MFDLVGVVGQHLGHCGRDGAGVRGLFIAFNLCGKVEQYRAGKEALFGFFVGQTMKAMAGKANPQVINERLKAKLAK